MNLTAPRVYVVRHGESEANSGLLWQGWGDAPLTKRGHEQAEECGKQLASLPWSGILSSDRRRALQTAVGILNQSDHHRDLPPLQVHWDLRERHYGGFENLTSPEVERHYPGGLWTPDSGQNRMEWRPYGGEVLSEVLRRNMAILEKIRLAGRCGCYLVASHGNVLRLLLAHALGLPEPDHRIPKNCSVLVLDLPLSSPGRLEVIKEPEWDGPL